MGLGKTSEDERVDVVNISLQSGVLSSFTAFIAINKELNKPVQGPLTHRVIPRPLMDVAVPCLTLSGMFYANLSPYLLYLLYLSTTFKQWYVSGSHKFKLKYIS